MSVNQCPGGTLYAIRAGDTLFVLAGRFNTTVAALLAANPGIDPNNLQIGQIICIPGVPVPGCPGGTLYTIQAGDTFFLIAQRYGISVAALIAANPGVDPTRLQIGQTICIPGVAPPLPVPCCRVLEPIEGITPVPAGPFTPAGVVLLQAGNGQTLVTFAVSGLPDPETFGDFDTYGGNIIIPAAQANVAPEVYGVLLVPAGILDQPVVWAGSRVIPRLLTPDTFGVVNPFNFETGVSTNPILRGAVPPCQ